VAKEDKTNQKKKMAMLTCKGVRPAYAKSTPLVFLSSAPTWVCDTLTHTHTPTPLMAPTLSHLFFLENGAVPSLLMADKTLGEVLAMAITAHMAMLAGASGTKPGDMPVGRVAALLGNLSYSHNFLGYG
jgi:hypothetical protein